MLIWREREREWESKTVPKHNSFHRNTHCLKTSSTGSKSLRAKESRVSVQ